jgi:hypothetical protein
LFSSTIGAIAGLPEIVQGFESHDSILVIKGIALVLLGFATNEKGGEDNGK